MHLRKSSSVYAIIKQYSLQICEITLSSPQNLVEIEIPTKVKHQRIILRWETILLG
ncbi:hypothetical protein H1P_1790004 [Hyella patelloides LEGE 07179]|uniref:Uncharacterized protein n=1 Tax=Hyella patelloides LEGE 07179 TaxID=945734 RepID=A0A563VNH1_9CYAN|nr:hypothetical protein H1P_1790004 [Hyella patelloides LEGE 07179]